MATEVVTSGLVRKGKLKVRLTPDFQAGLKSFRDGPVTVRIERKRASRSHKANAFYWGVVVAELSEHTGHTPEELHEYLKARFIPKRLALANQNGEVVDELVIGGSTVKLDVVQFYEYVQEIKQWALDSLGVLIPEPTET